MTPPINVLVTALEQRARPSLPKASAPPHLRTALLRAERPPLHFYRYLYDAVGRPYNWVSRKQMSDAELTEIVHDLQTHIYVLMIDGAPGGMAELSFRAQPVGELSFFGLTPERIGCGLGRFFLTQVIELAWDQGISNLTVETCTLDHPAALPLYQKMGFTVVSRRRGLAPTLAESHS
ncbi:MAG: GNAT family N-acetyltransferase [Pseudomonadota bacterium]